MLWQGEKVLLVGIYVFASLTQLTRLLLSLRHLLSIVVPSPPSNQLQLELLEQTVQRLGQGNCQPPRHRVLVSVESLKKKKG